MKKKYLLDGAFVCTVFATIILFEWSWEHIKILISGGAIGAWIMTRVKN